MGSPTWLGTSWPIAPKHAGTASSKSSRNRASVGKRILTSKARAETNRIACISVCPDSKPLPNTSCIQTTDQNSVVVRTGVHSRGLVLQTHFTGPAELFRLFQAHATAGCERCSHRSMAVVAGSCGRWQSGTGAFHFRIICEAKTSRSQCWRHGKQKSTKTHMIWKWNSRIARHLRGLFSLRSVCCYRLRTTASA